MNNAGGTLAANGTILKVEDASTSTAGTFTNATKLIDLFASDLSTGSVINIDLPNSRVASTNPVLNIVLGNTQTQASTLAKLDTGTSAVASTALSISAR